MRIFDNTYYNSIILNTDSVTTILLLGTGSRVAVVSYSEFRHSHI